MSETLTPMMQQYQRLRPLLVAVTFALSWLNLIAPPRILLAPELDLSWAGALIYFAERGVQHGRDIICTWGPLGHLTSFVYTGEGFTSRIVWEIASSAVFAAIVTAAVLRLPLLLRVPFFVYFLLFPSGFDWVGMLILAALAAELFHRGAEQPVLNLFAAVVLGVFSLIKFTLLLVALLVLLLVGGRYLWQKRFAPALTLAVGFGATFLVTWKAAGQDFANLWAFLRYSLELTTGYKGAMAVQMVKPTVMMLGLTAALLGFALCVILFLSAPSWRRIWPSVFFATALFISWNHGFVRADDHVLHFFTLCPLLITLIWNATPAERRVRPVGYALAFGVFFACLAGMWSHNPGLITHRFPETAKRFEQAWKTMISPRKLERSLAQRLTAEKPRWALPRVRAEVGQATIDVLGFEQGIAILNDLNYSPHPGFQNYNGYTPALIDANIAFYRSAKAPAYVLLKVQPIDGRVPALDDAHMLRQVLLDYTFLFDEGGYGLWRRNPGPAARGRLEPVAQRRTAFTGMVEVPAEPFVWVELEVRPSFLGRLRAALYKPPEVFLHCIDSTGLQTRNRLVTAMATRGFLVSPRLSNTEDVIRLARGEALPSVVAFSLEIGEADRRFFSDSIDLRFFSSDGVESRVE